MNLRSLASRDLDPLIGFVEEHRVANKQKITQVLDINFMLFLSEREVKPLSKLSEVFIKLGREIRASFCQPFSHARSAY